MKLRKVLLTGIGLALVAVISIAGTLAYLTSEDSDVNVMTLGNVEIDQHEYERVQNADGTYEMITSAKYGEGYKLKDFNRGKPLYPATGEITGWGTVVPFDQINGASGAQAVFAGLNNVQDKFVLVENTGKSDAYVRTIIALEYGSNTKDIIGISTGDFWDWNEIGITEIDGNNYFVYEAIYQGSDVRHKGGVLPAGEFTYNSLGQVYLKNEATNEDVKALDGNDNGTYDILVRSQAVQVAGFENADDAFENVSTFALRKTVSAAEIALDTAFGDTTVDNHPWVDSEVEIPGVIGSFDDLKKAGKNGGKYLLSEDLHITDKSQFFYGSYVTVIYKDMELDLNGHSITIDVEMPTVAKAPVLFYVYSEGASLKVVGDGDIIAKHDAFIFFPRSASDGVEIYGGNYYNNDDTSGTKGDINAIGYSQTKSKINVYGGTFTFKNVNGHCGAFNVYDNQGAEIILHEGVLLSESNYYLGSDANEIHLAEGCQLKQTVIDGKTWYQVVKK